MKRTRKWLSSIVVCMILSGCLPFPEATDSASDPARFDGDAYRVGNLDGVLADNLNARLVLKNHAGTGSKAPFIIAADVLGQLTADEQKSIQSAYDGGYPLVLVQADQDSILQLHRLLGDESFEFEMPENTTRAELYAIDKEDDGSLWEWVQYPPATEATESGVVVWTDDQGVEQTDILPESMVPLADDDDSQDLRVDGLSEWLEEDDHRWQTPSGLAAKTRALAASNDQLTSLAKAFVKTSVFQQIKNKYQISHFIWSCHAAETGSDWVYIQQQCVFNAKGNWDINNKARAYTDSRMYYLGQVTLNSRVEGYDNDVDNVTLIRSSPETANNTKEVMSGLDYNIGGEVSAEGLKINGGISIHDSTTFQVSDCTVFNQSNTSGNNAQWEYVFARVGATGFWKNHLSMPPNLSISTFQPVNQWLWMMSPDVRKNNPKIKVSLNVALMQSHLDYYLVYHPVSHYEVSFASDAVIPLPLPPIE